MPIAFPELVVGRKRSPQATDTESTAPQMLLEVLRTGYNFAKIRDLLRRGRQVIVLILAMSAPEMEGNLSIGSTSFPLDNVPRSLIMSWIDNGAAVRHFLIPNQPAAQALCHSCFLEIVSIQDSKDGDMSERTEIWLS